MFKKFFGKKNEGFYLQIEDDSNAPKPPAKAKSQPPVNEKVANVPVEPVASATPLAQSTAKSDAKADKEAAKATKKAASNQKKTEATKKAEELKASVVAPAAPAPVITNFATDYLIKPSSTSTRRRPGANMNMFLDMARQAKKPANIK
jgi:hypothetical protein